MSNCLVSVFAFSLLLY